MTYTLEIYLQSEAEDALPMTARTAEEVDAAIKRVLTAAGTFNHNPTAYVVEGPKWKDKPGHGLKFDVAPEENIAALVYFGPGSDSPSMSLSNLPTGNASPLYRDIDSATPFPANAAITLDHLRAAVHEFHESGGLRPTCVDWQPADGW
ncbi:Immunity protein Imm1 [Streptoalloteichus tenebrarius]|uniref:Immunity protein Imm1 n=1 Tax=Streptoalloteichus tenebrarius (strain ATCC 17920 / DSM 40477 / JCM 4838 / CBS 697.72 / NBRC 16177 / NCIMB 11028 / NRRL B-12390 / A12253. 1 / ISP 5477) TaxID=1933 RepID=A0ABT1HP21_STRSD|nr:Imm1 family immunity protein [Streptoalloteichus tenebrarius]MCP2257269.1 Immunity protein Imm1 [Streptoalloteichus tenebrarius]BFF04176.1 hypothetical protein GCM10020241_58510 [Streptoalloteichus tenebrarius]